MSAGYNSDKYVLHFLDNYSRMNYIYILVTKKLITQMVQDFITFVHKQYNQTIQILRTDRETALGKQFIDWTLSIGITTEYSSPYTPEQNGAAERSRGVIMAKARAIWIDAHLLEFLWPKTVKMAAYLTNRSSTKWLNWKTPLEELQQALNVHNPKPNISHLKVYGCQAYPNIPH